jgi:hypothetical protein
VEHLNQNMHVALASVFSMFIFGFFRILVGGKYISSFGTKSTEANSLYFTVFSIDRVDF